MRVDGAENGDYRPGFFFCRNQTLYRVYAASEVRTPQKHQSEKYARRSYLDVCKDCPEYNSKIYLTKVEWMGSEISPLCAI